MRRNVKKQWNRKLFVPFTLSYLALLVLPLLLGLALYGIAYRMVSEQLIAYQVSLLESAGNTVDQSLLMLEDFAATLNGMQNVRELTLSRHRKDGVTTASISTIVKLLPKLKDSSGLIDHYVIYSAYNDFLLAPGQGYLQLARYYDTHFRYGQLSGEEWLDFIMKPTNWYVMQPHADTVYGGKASATLLYIQPLLTSATGMPNGAILFYIDETRVLQMLSTASQQDAGIALLMDRDGRLLTALGDVPAGPFPTEAIGLSGGYNARWNGERSIITYYRSPRMGYTYYSITPHSTLSQRIHGILRTIVMAVGLILVLGALLAAFLLHYNKKPLTRIAARLTPSSEGTTGLWMLDESIHRLLSDHEHMARQLGEQKAHLRTVFASRLISGDFADARDLDMMKAHLDLLIDGKCFRGVYVRMDDEPSISSHWLARMESFRAILMELLTPQTHLWYLSLKDSRQIALLYAEETERDASFMDHFKALYTMLHQQYGIKTTWYLGMPCDSLMKVHRSFVDAHNLLDQNVLNDEKFLIVSEDVKDDDCYDYAFAQEQQLINQAMSGHGDAVSALLSRIHARNFVQRKLSMDMRQLLYHRMLSTFVTLSMPYHTPMPDWAARMETLSSRTFFQCMDDAYQVFCAQHRDKKSKAQQRMVQEMKALIDTRFTDQNLSLTYVALQFSLNESYLSILFKEQFGANFSTYIEQKRIAYAHTLLRGTQLPIGEIASQSGYSNANSFSRAYKRVMGNSPTDTRHESSVKKR